ncbi:glycosyltransferase family 10 domain-containing protein, partial [Akkermansia muciniphila]
LYIKPMQEILDQKEFPKTKMLSTICSAKQHTHTMHKKRYDLTRYLADRLPELDWFGHGIREIENKTVAMDDYKYHLCVENHLEPHHWTEKLSDAFVAMTLPFYAGDPLATECFPQESFIPIPLDNPQKALEIIRKAMEDGEYEKRLPAIRAARRLVLEKYNMFAQTAAVIHNHRETGTIRPGAMLKGRHVLRKNPLNALRELADTLAYKIRSRGRRGTGTGA